MNTYFKWQPPYVLDPKMKQRQKENYCVNIFLKASFNFEDTL